MQVVCGDVVLQRICYNLGILRAYHGSIPAAPQTNNLREVKSRHGHGIHCRCIWGVSGSLSLAWTWALVLVSDLIRCREHRRRRQWHPTPALLPGKSHGWRSLVGCSPWGYKELDTTERLHFHFSLSCIGEGNGNPLQCSCLENPRDRGAWWAAVYGVTQSRTQLKRLSSSSSREHRYHQKHLKQNAWIAMPSSRGSSRPSHIILWIHFLIRANKTPFNDNPLQYSCLENPMDRGVWQAAIHGVAESQTWLSDWACMHTRHL